MKTRAIFSAIFCMAAAACGVALLVAQQPQAGPYTQDQAVSGYEAYQANCMACHGADLSGGQGPALAGPAFMQQWGDRQVSALVNYLQVNMPPGGANLPTDAYVNLVAYILDANGARAGNSVMTQVSSTVLSAVAPGERAAYLVAGGRPAGQARGSGKGGSNEPEGITVAGVVEGFVPVTDEMLLNPDPANWMMIRRDYNASSFSPLDQVTTDNVDELQLAWSWALEDVNVLGNAPAPIEYNGVLYVNNGGEVLQALDATTGELIWENRYGTNANAAAQRGIAIYGDKIFLSTSDAHLMAFDARTGKVAWNTTMGDRSEGGYGSTAGPLPVKGKLLQTLGFCGTYRTEKCFVSAYDADTGKEEWRFTTIALEGEPGGDTWGGLPNLQRVGAESWATPSYDPDLNLTYWGTAQAKPWMRASRGSGNGATLWANSTLALNPDTGKMDWYYSHAPGESLDLDEAFERVLVNDQGRNLVFSAGKPGILWKLDRRTGQHLGHKEMVFQNVYDSFDPETGEPHYRNDIIEAQIGEWVQSCPSTEGGKNWPTMSYYQPGNRLIVPLSQSCMEFNAQEVDKTRGAGAGGGARARYFEMPGTDGKVGKLGGL